MSGLVLKLAPRERFLVNGAVVQNGDRRSKISILTKEARILRLRHAIHPKHADTPVKRVCYMVQLAMLDEQPSADALDEIVWRVKELSTIFADYESHVIIESALQSIQEERLYQCFRALQRLVPQEDRLLRLRTTDV
jgi:flagellar protein FlbT